MVYIVLLISICILVMFMLAHKKKPQNQIFDEEWHRKINDY